MNAPFKPERQCGNCKIRPAADGGKQCQQCRDSEARSRARYTAAGLCQMGCGNPIDTDRSKNCCTGCLEKRRQRSAEGLSTPGGKRCHRIADDTRKVAVGFRMKKGKRINHAGSKHLEWSHADFVARFGELNASQRIDHIIPRRVLIRLDGSVDEQASRAIAGLWNLRLVTNASNTRTGANIDAAIVGQAHDFRSRFGLDGDSLIIALLDWMNSMGFPHPNAGEWMKPTE